MPARFDVKKSFEAAASGIRRDPRLAVRLLLGLLLAANIAAGIALWKPWGATPEELERQLADVRRQLQQRQASLERLRAIVAKVETARRQGDEFIAQHFLHRRTASSAIVAELREAAAKAGVKQAEQTFAFEPIEGAEDLEMLTISGSYEGSYENLVKFLNLLDRSPRFLIVDTLTAAPQRTAGVLNVNVKMNAFIIHGGEEVPAPPPNAETGTS
jgi:type IV pilus assembly protein PilO